MAIGTVIKFYRIDIGTTAIQVGMLLIAVLLFQGSLRIRITCYAVFMLTLAVIEINSSNIFLFIKQLISHKPHIDTAINTVNSVSDAFLVTVLNIFTGFIFYYKATPLLKHFFLSIKTSTFIQLILPLYLPFVIQIIFYQRHFGVWINALIYFLPLLASCILFNKGIQKVRFEEEQRAIKEHRIQLVKEQLDFSMKMEKEYQRIRKWNHDIENHLTALCYLMDMKKSEEAAVYSKKLLSKIEDDSGGTYET
ncbi:hypothetical protein [Ruminococcus sp. 5_1_39BFAA]|uniref:hypothetical protein n=1 Tax=Ruminococcus sp. 5_1_39BFAA TaxID=457412 RepID=UPI0035629BAB